jgi:hypothetical protein
MANWANAIATAFLVVLGVLGYFGARNALRLSERAWLSSTGASIKPVEIKPADNPQSAPTVVYIKRDQPIYFTLSCSNSGKEPALNVKPRILNSTIEGYDPLKTVSEAIQVPENTSCDGLLPEKGHYIIPPSANMTMNVASNFGEPSLIADDKLVNGEKFYVVRGCIAYDTIGAVHRSGFCYIFDTRQRPGYVPSFENCLRGFYID